MKVIKHTVHFFEFMFCQSMWVTGQHPHVSTHLTGYIYTDIDLFVCSIKTSHINQQEFWKVTECSGMTERTLEGSQNIHLTTKLARHQNVVDFLTLGL